LFLYLTASAKKWIKNSIEKYLIIKPIFFEHKLRVKTFLYSVFVLNWIFE